MTTTPVLRSKLSQLVDSSQQGQSRNFYNYHFKKRGLNVTLHSEVVAQQQQGRGLDLGWVSACVSAGFLWGALVTITNLKEHIHKRGIMGIKRKAFLLVINFRYFRPRCPVCFYGLCQGFLFSGRQRCKLHLPSYAAHHEGLHLPVCCHSPSDPQWSHRVCLFLLFSAFHSTSATWETHKYDDLNSAIAGTCSGQSREENSEMQNATRHFQSWNHPTSHHPLQEWRTSSMA